MVGRTDAPPRDGRTRCQDAPRPVVGESGRPPVPSGPCHHRSPARSRSPARRRAGRGRLRRRRAVVRSDRCRAPPTGPPRVPTRTSRRASRRPTRAAGRTRSTRGATARREPRQPRRRRHRRDPVRRRDVGLRRQPGRGARRLPGPRPDRRRHRRLLRRERRGGEPDRDHRRVDARRSPARRPAASTARPAIAHPDRRGLAGAEPDTVNVVITNDLPDPKIEAAVAAFGGVT